MTREEILTAARACVSGERYGTPEDNFGTIAKLWSTYTGTAITPIDVAVMMALLKCARIKSGFAVHDSFVDIAGYAACGGELINDKH